MKVFTGKIDDLPERKVDEKNGVAFDDNVLFLPEDGPGQKLAQAGIPYSQDFHDAVAAKSKKWTPPAENKAAKPGENKAAKPGENK